MFMIIALCLFVSSSILVYLVTGISYDRAIILLIGYLSGVLFGYSIAKTWLEDKASSHLLSLFNSWEDNFKKRSGL